MTERNESLIKGFLALFGGKIGLMLIGLVVTPILTRGLGDSDFGVYAVVMSAVAISLTFSEAGIFSAVRKYIAEDRDTTNWKSHVFSFYIRLGTITLGIALFVLISLYSVSESVQKLFTSPLTFVIFLGVLAARQFASITRSTLMGLSLEEYSESLKVGQQLLFASTSAVVLYLGFSVNTVLAAHIAGALVFVGVALWFLHKRLSMGFILKRTPDKIDRKELFYFNVENIILILLTISLYHLDILLLGVLTTSESTGHYKAAAQVSEVIWMVPTAIATLFVHNISPMWLNSEIDPINELTSTAIKYTIMLSLLMAGGLFLLADRFIPLYLGSEFSASVRPMQLLLPGVVCFAISQPIYSVGQAKGDLKPLIVATFLSASLNLVLNLLLIPLYGLTGAAIATSIGYGSMLVFHYVSALQIGFRPFAGLPFARLGFVTAIVYLLLAVADWLIPVPTLSLVVLPPVGLLGYLLLAYRTGLIQQDEIQTVRDALPSF